MNELSKFNEPPRQTQFIVVWRFSSFFDLFFIYRLFNSLSFPSTPHSLSAGGRVLSSPHTTIRCPTGLLLAIVFSSVFTAHPTSRPPSPLALVRPSNERMRSNREWRKENLQHFLRLVPPTDPPTSEKWGLWMCWWSNTERRDHSSLCVCVRLSTDRFMLRAAFGIPCWSASIHDHSRAPSSKRGARGVFKRTCDGMQFLH